MDAETRVGSGIFGCEGLVVFVGTICTQDMKLYDLGLLIYFRVTQ